MLATGSKFGLYSFSSVAGNFRNARRGNKLTKLPIILAVQVVETNDLPDDWLCTVHMCGGGGGWGGGWKTPR